MSQSETKPCLSPSVYIAEGAIVRGDVTMGDRASIWFNAVVRGDEGPVRIGECSNVQDCCVLHSDLGIAVDIGAWVTIGHGAVIRGARIADRVMIGMHATVMTGAVIGEGCIVGAASFVPYRAQFPPGSLIVGFQIPYKFVAHPLGTHSQQWFAGTSPFVFNALQPLYRSRLPPAPLEGEDSFTPPGIQKSPGATERVRFGTRPCWHRSCRTQFARWGRGIRVSSARFSPPKPPNGNALRRRAGWHRSCDVQLQDPSWSR